ncbi:hypothetical protein ES703_17275 [subsurface metagenome]
MQNKLPDPKVIVSAAVGSAIEVAEAPVRALGNVAGVVENYTSHVKANMDTLKRAPEDPGVLVSVALNGISHTLADGLAFFKGIGKAAMDTAEGVETNLKRLTG